MRILYVITKSELGGAQTVVQNLANTLCADHEITVIAGEGDGKMFDALDKRVKKIYYPHLQRRISLYNDARTAMFLWKINREIKPDIIHLHSSKAGLLGRLVFPKKKTVYTVHGFDSIRIAYRPLLPLERFMQKRCAAIIGVSKYDITNLKNEGISNNVHLVYNGILQPVTTQQNLSEITKSFDKTILCIARVAPPKRYDLFIECAKKLPEYAFVWIGNKEPVSNVPNNVFFLGNVLNAGNYCQYADIFILPSDYEGLPIVILEAMSHAKPIIASAVGGVPEIVINNKNGFVVQNTVDSFVEKIDYILKNEDIYRQFSTYSYDLYQQHFTMEKMVEEYLKIYNSI